VDTSGVPNDHYEYAITWFGLAAVWAVMSCPDRRVRGAG
jgi:surfeit locus 1 family protein